MAIYQWREVLTSNAHKSVGKFRIVVDEDDLGEVWSIIEHDIASGVLGVCAKVTSHPVESSGKHVAYVYFTIGQREQCRRMLKGLKLVEGPHYTPT